MVRQKGFPAKRRGGAVLTLGRLRPRAKSLDLPPRARLLVGCRPFDFALRLQRNLQCAEQRGEIAVCVVGQKNSSNATAPGD
jgi:hypothetical protein